MIKKIGIAIALLSLLFVFGCGKDKDSPGEAGGPEELEISTDPVTLVFASHFPVDEQFQRLYLDPVKEKLPHITLEVIPGLLANMEQYMIAGNVPDLHLTYNGLLNDLHKLDYMEDAMPLIRRHNIDLDRFKDNYLEDIQAAVLGHEALYGLPIETAFHALYYNIDIFDEFGVDYPKDGMTWDDALDLARRLTRVEGDVRYRGFDPNNVLRVAQPLGLVYVDPVTEKSVLGSDPGWQRAFELAKQILSIPGNEPGTAQQNARNGFLNSRTTAMFIDVNMFIPLEQATAAGLNWDVAQHPSYPDRPNVFGNASVYVPLVTKTTRYKDQAMQVVQVWTSDEAQMSFSRTGRVSTLKNEQVHSEFGKDNPMLDGKNVAGIVKSVPVQYPLYLYRSQSEAIVRSKFNDYLAGTKDLGTVLREGDEEINRMVEAEKLK